MLNSPKSQVSLYKFRVLKNLSHKEILTNNLLSFPSPDKFNDPFDSSIPIRYDQGGKNEITKYWEDFLKKEKPELHRKERNRP